MSQLDHAPHFEGWEVVEKLGEGGMCSVWRARPASGEGPERAIKMLLDSTEGAVQRFADEARLLQRIDHPNVLRIHSLHEQDRPPWIVMELLAGRDLEESRMERGAMDPELAARLIADVANGLARVHDLGVRHRDIKPANIMLGHDGVPRLIDFGIARETSRAHVTQKGFVVGTASYLPPEIFMEDDAQRIQDTVEADVYALGQTLCEILIGQAIHPIDGEGTSTLVQIMKDKVERLHLDPREWRPQVPVGLSEVVMAATAQEPEDRLRSAAELEQRLRAWLADRHAGESAPVSAVDIASLPPPPGSRPPTPAPAALRGGTPALSFSSRTATPAPVARRAAGTAAASAMGVGLISVGYLALAGVGVLALILLAPTPPEVDPDRPQAVQEALGASEGALGRCAGPDTRGTAVLAFRASSGAPQGVEVVSSELPEAVTACLVREVAALDLPEGDTVSVQLPVELR